MTESQHPKTRKVETLKSVTNWVFFRMPISKFTNNSVFLLFSNHAKATWYYQNLVITKQRKKNVNSQSKRMCLDLGG